MKNSHIILATLTLLTIGFSLGFWVGLDFSLIELSEDIRVYCAERV